MDKTAVVFVHGFTGGESTWENKKGVKFSSLLSADLSISNNFDFFHFEYFTEVLGIWKSAPIQTILNCLPLLKKIKGVGSIKKNQPIRRLSLLLDSYIRTNLSDYNEVIIIAHSMGGLVAKGYILNHQFSSGPVPVGYISIAVPHKGSLNSLILSPTKNINIKELTPLNEYTDNLNSDWSERKESLPNSIYITAIHDQHVSDVSSLPFRVNAAERFVVDHDHNSVCKPADANDPCYKIVLSFLQNFIYKKEMNFISRTSFALDESNYDKEIFVIKLIIESINSKGIDDAKESFFHAEIISKAADLRDRQLLSELQSKVLSLYRQSYSAACHKTPSEIFKEVHDKLLAEDNNVLRSSVEYINFLHKKGLLHQLANKMDTRVVWSELTTIDKIQGNLNG